MRCFGVLASCALALGLVGAPVEAQTSRLPSIENTDGPDLRALETFDQIRPYAAVGRLNTGDGFCTATLIAADIILTAAHCLVTDDGVRRPDSAFTFLAGLRNGRVEAQRSISRSVIHPEYDVTIEDGQGDVQWVRTDIALLQLDRPIVNGVSPILVNGRAHEGDRVQIVSYGRDRENYASLEDGCSVLNIQSAVVTLSCQVVPGSSGSPVLVETGVGLRIISVVSAMAQWRVEQDRFDPVTLSAALDGEMQSLLRMMQEDAPEMTPVTDQVGALPQVRQLTGGGESDGLSARFVRP